MALLRIALLVAAAAVAACQTLGDAVVAGALAAATSSEGWRQNVEATLADPARAETVKLELRDDALDFRCAVFGNGQVITTAGRFVRYGSMTAAAAQKVTKDFMASDVFATEETERDAPHDAATLGVWIRQGSAWNRSREEVPLDAVKKLERWMATIEGACRKATANPKLVLSDQPSNENIEKAIAAKVVPDWTANVTMGLRRPIKAGAYREWQLVVGPKTIESRVKDERGQTLSEKTWKATSTDLTGTLAQLMEIKKRKPQDRVVAQQVVLGASAAPWDRIGGDVYDVAFDGPSDGADRASGMRKLLRAWAEKAARETGKDPVALVMGR